MRAKEQAFRTQRAELAAVGLGDREYARAFRQETGISFPLLVDEKREAYQAMELKSANLFHLLRKDNFEARTRAKVAGHSHGETGPELFKTAADAIKQVCRKINVPLAGA